MKSILATAAAAILSLAVWRHAAPGGAMFYQGIAAAGLAAGLHWIWNARRSGMRAAAPCRDAMLVFLLVYSFIFTVPTTVDRSYSVRMLNQVAGAAQGMTRDQLVTHFSVEFASAGAVDRRLREQAMSGTLVKSGDSWVLTPLGTLLTRAFATTCLVFACEVK
jgi:hypothetical protein